MTDRDQGEEILKEEDKIGTSVQEPRSYAEPEERDEKSAEEPEIVDSPDKDAAPQEPPVNKFRYYIRILCGGYLVYLSYQLFMGEGAEKLLVKLAAVVFTAVGLFLIIISAKELLKKK